MLLAILGLSASPDGSSADERVDVVRLPGITRRRLRVWAPALVLLLVLASAAGTSQPLACSPCHSEHYRFVRSSSHASTTCYECHLPNGAWSLPEAKAREVTQMYPGQLLGSLNRRPPANETARAACLNCHEDVLYQLVGSNGLRVLHSACAGTGSCDACHARVAHGEEARRAGQPVMDACIACHRQREAATDCAACHDERVDRVRLDTGPWQVTHGASWESTHGMGDLLSCATCHQEDFCVRCHGVPLPHPPDFGGTHGDSGVEGLAGCRTCHKTQEFCSDCHGMEMPHPEGFLQQHSSLAEGLEDPSCMRCHGSQDCIDCHTFHVHPGGPNAPVQVPRWGDD